MATRVRKSRHTWSANEDRILMVAVEKFGTDRGPVSESRWSEVSRMLPGRSNKDCRKRWFHSLDPTVRKGRWDNEEDRILLDAYSRLGPAWKEIASLIPGRKDDQCAKRYNDILHPDAKDRLTTWTRSEDEILTQSVNRIGHRWSQISAGLSGRPPLTCRNRWRALEKHRASRSHGDGGTDGNDMQRSVDRTHNAEVYISRTDDNMANSSSVWSTADADSLQLSPEPHLDPSLTNYDLTDWLPGMNMNLAELDVLFSGDWAQLTPDGLSFGSTGEDDYGMNHATVVPSFAPQWQDMSTTMQTTGGLERTLNTPQEPVRCSYSIDSMQHQIAREEVVSTRVPGESDILHVVHHHHVYHHHIYPPPAVMHP